MKHTGLIEKLKAARAVLETMRWCGGYDPIERRTHRRCWAKAVREITDAGRAEMSQ